VAQVLDAAALTYVAAFVGAIGSMGYFVSSIFGGKR
jgi:Zn-dependent membrane protease YugP